jgi:endonuclease YncB( thermonuclease family)
MFWKIYDYQLRKAEKKTNFSYAGLKFKAKVVDIYDGDTLTVVFRYRGQLQQHRCRMLGYDSPEMKPLRSKKGRDKEIEKAKEAKEALSNLIFGHNGGIVKIKCHQFDKYGRLLIDLYIPKGCVCLCSYNKIWVNQWMINNNYGYVYDGGTKKEFKIDSDKV